MGDTCCLYKRPASFTSYIAYYTTTIYILSFFILFIEFQSTVEKTPLNQLIQKKKLQVIPRGPLSLLGRKWHIGCLLLLLDNMATWEKVSNAPFVKSPQVMMIDLM